MTLADAVAESVLDKLDRYPPSAPLFSLFRLCESLRQADHPVLNHALTVWFVNGICKHLPDAFTTTPTEFYIRRDWDGPYSGPNVPLYDLLPMGEIIISVHGHFLYDYHDLSKHNLLDGLRQALRKNDASAYGLSLYHRSKTKVPLPNELDWSPEELVNKFLHHTPFYDFFHTQVPFRIPKKTFASHGIILAPPNHGKTQLLGALIARFLKEEDPVGAFILDPHGDLFNVLRDRVAPDRCVVIDPDEDPPPLNFLDFGTSNEAQTLQTFTYLMSSLSGGLTDKQGAIAPYLLKLLRRIEGASLETLRQIVDERVKSPAQSQFAAAIASLPIVDQGFFSNQFYTGKMDDTKQAIGWKIYSAMASDAFREMFSAKTNSVDFDQLIADRKVVLVKGARRSLGDEGMRVFLQFMVAQYFAAGLRRDRLPPERRHLCILFADEAHTVMDSPIIANILVELRKFGCGFFGATQTWHQVAEDVKAAVLGATAIRILGPISHNDAVVLARECYTTPDFIRDMKAVEGSHADWAFYVSGMTDHAARVRVPYGILDALPRQKRTVRLPPRRSLTGNAVLARPVEQRVEVDKDEEGFRKDEREWILADMKAAEEASGATIKPGRDWSESDE